MHKILLNVCTHGDELVGLRVADHFAKSPLVQKEILTIHVANKEAVKAGKRFIDKDLNRVFPGDPHGCHEERLAHSLVPFIEGFDFVMDVHSTNTGVTSAVMLNEFSGDILSIVQAIAPKRALVMSATKSRALISAAKLAIAFECGKDSDPETYEETVRGIERCLAHFGLFEKTMCAEADTKKDETVFLEAFKTVPKPEGFVVSGEINNFELITRGTLIGMNPETGESVFAEDDFYPILFGKNTYKDIFGFAGRRVRLK